MLCRMQTDSDSLAAGHDITLREQFDDKVLNADSDSESESDGMP